MDVMRSGSYETVAANQSDQPLGAAGAAGDVLAALIIVPGTTSPGAVSIKDGAGGGAITVFPGGASSVNELRPIVVPLGMAAVTAASGGWRVTTGADVTVIAIGRFT